MPTARVLVTGGAGFIGSHLVDRLLAQGHDVTVIDNLTPQVHAKRPGYLPPQAKLVRADVGDPQAFGGVLADVDRVYHFAAAVGIGQSMYEIGRYVEDNTLATARLLDALVRREHPVKKLVVASSMSIYGEGLYRCREHGPVAPKPRSESRLQKGDWEQRCPECAGVATPVPTPESKPAQSTSVYALTKKDQEDLCLVVGRAYGIPTVALRLFNTYGPRQSLSNPYTGVCAIFSSRLKSNRPPVVYEDGQQSRDFVSVRDVVDACVRAGERSAADYEAVNVGTGQATTVLQVARTLGHLYGKNVAPVIEAKYRAGDIRHCVADVSKAERLLDYRPQVSFEAGMRELVEWGSREPSEDRFDEAQNELVARGLLSG